MQANKTENEDKIKKLIRETKLKIKKLDIPENFSYNLDLWLNLIYICVEKKHFFASTVQIRAYRNLIFSFIKENIILLNYRKVIMKYNEYLSLKGLTDLESINKSKLLFEEIKLMSMRINERIESNNLSVIIRKLKETDNLYYKNPVIFCENFKNIDVSNWILSIEDSKIMKKLDKKVISYIKNEILISKEKIEYFEKSNNICNNGVHKNNYESEDFDENVYFSQWESVILQKMLKIYNIILFKAISEWKDTSSAK